MCYFKEEVNDELYFWHADKHQSLLKVDTIILVMYNQTCPKYSKQQLNIFAMSQGKRKGWSWFFHGDTDTCRF